MGIQKYPKKKQNLCHHAPKELVELVEKVEPQKNSSYAVLPTLTDQQNP